MLRALGLVVLAGALGGFVNALIAERVPFPQLVIREGTPVWLPGFIGTVIVGAVAAAISYGLYGPVAHLPLLGRRAGATAPVVPLTLAAFAGAILIGYAGSRWIQAEANKTLNHVTAVETAKSLASISNGTVTTPSANVLTPEEARIRGNDLLLKLQEGSALEAYEAVLRLDPLRDPASGNNL